MTAMVVPAWLPDGGLVRRTSGVGATLSPRASLPTTSGAPAAFGAASSSSPELAPLQRIRQAFPPAPEENASHYARRVYRASRQGDARAQVNGQALTLPLLSRLTGLRVANLRRDPHLRDLPPDLEPIARAFPRNPGERDSPYARRIHYAGEWGDSRVLVNGQRLNLRQLSALSGVTAAGLRRDPHLWDFPPELEHVLIAFPPEPNESALDYARRLHFASQGGDARAQVLGQPLNLTQLASLSLVDESTLSRDVSLRPLPPSLQLVAQAFPRLPRETNIVYARRLHAAGARGDARATCDGCTLSLEHLAWLSGAKVAKLNQDPLIRPFPRELMPIVDSFPREPLEPKLSYARRLHRASQQGDPKAQVNGQPLDLMQLAALSNLSVSHLRRVLIGSDVANGA